MPQAALIRWNAAIKTHADLIAAHQYEELAKVVLAKHLLGAYGGPSSERVMSVEYLERDRDYSFISHPLRR